ncbi:NAD(+) synthase [Candidatus Fermentibacterales bacterium]|nr:NAD(+) synthase [Candidatus Fermentibacterales bacterium]
MDSSGSSDPGVFPGLAQAISGWVGEQLIQAGAGGVVLGLSGGIDSAVCAALCCRAVGPSAVLALALPCDSEPSDLRDAARVASDLGLDLRTIVLDRALESLLTCCGLDRGDRLTVANIKARLRMTVIYAHSRGRLVVGTGNYAEYLMGYFTKWGDGACDIMPLGRLFKDEVRRLAEVLGLPGFLLGKEPSAGLWPGQTDEGDMGVTYDQIRRWAEGGDPGPEAARIMSSLSSAAGHKRGPVPVFEAREWMVENA